MEEIDNGARSTRMDQRTPEGLTSVWNDLALISAEGDGDVLSFCREQDVAEPSN